jgi:hypothetical protein
LMRGMVKGFMLTEWKRENLEITFNYGTRGPPIKTNM